MIRSPGTCRWVAEQSDAALTGSGQLRIRWQSRDDIHEAFPTLACAIIC
jgi:hypothetical protein